jgi:uncharacterized protein YfaS (alpha-2-macroglobulin family)
MKNCFLLFSILLLPFCLSAQTQSAEPYASDWAKADSLLQNGLPESAAKIVKGVYDKAKQKSQQVQMMKAQLYLMNADMQKGEDAYKDAISKAEEQERLTSFPDNAIWQSIAAQLYWNYYQQNRWKIIGRTKTSGDTEIKDFEQWEAGRFFSKVSSLYLASVSRAADLEQIPIDKYDPILAKGVNSRNLRPTLLDLLAFRALEYFENDEKDVTAPAFAFVMNDPEAFAAADVFVAHSFINKDSTSLQWHALKLYQGLLRLHKDDASKDALIDADLHRLQFAYNKSVLSNKKQLYTSALERIEQAYGDNPLSSLAAVRRVQLMMDNENPGRGRKQSGTATTQHNYPLIKAQLEKIIAKHPASEGSVLAKNLLVSIQTKALVVTAEEVVLPQEPSKILIEYRNIPEAWIRVVKLPSTETNWARQYIITTELKNELLALKPVQSFSISLPGVEDMDAHSTEVKLDALPSGSYAIIASAKETFGLDDNIVNYTSFQVSSISVITQNNGQGYVLDRKIGVPLKNATLDFFTQKYNDSKHIYELVRAETTKSDNEGYFKHTGGKNQYFNALKIRYNEDMLLLAQGFSNYPISNSEAAQAQTFFFTDRSIYRPGQTIFFKGLMIRKEDKGRKNTVVAAQETTVDLYDVNGQKVNTKKFTTNEFGSFSGSFTAPEGMLNGNMRISNGNGEADFSVEEYKRPKFSVAFDTIIRAFALNETVSVDGKALAYAGNVIDGATVKYRVVRNTRWPYWWYAYRWGYPQSAEMEIAQGMLQTDKDGKFRVDFKAIPDLQVAPESLPVFTYSVTVDVTDINGETRNGSQMVSVGYTSLQLSINIPDKARPEGLDTLSILSLNLNDQFVATDMKIMISKLKGPGVLRKRLWPVPDQFVMDSISFKKLFPDDVYKSEDDHLTWASEATVFEKNSRSTKDGMVIVPQSTWKENGWYLVEATATDKNGRKITEKKYVQVWSEKNQGMVDEALVVVPQSQQTNPGGEAKVYTLSRYTQLHILRWVKDMNSQEVSSQLDYTGAPIVWSRKIGEADRGGISITYLAIKNNRVYTEQAYVNVPWDNKDLSISWETHRDKLQPGAPETWTMIVKGNKRDKVAAEMVATLYDASLDAFRPHEWNIYGLFPSLNTAFDWNTNTGFSVTSGQQLSYFTNGEQKLYEKSYDQLKLPEGLGSYGYRDAYSLNGEMYKSPMHAEAASMAVERMATDGPANAAPPFPSLRGQVATKRDDVSGGIADATKQGVQNAMPAVTPRKNLQETAFFLPQLKTDAEGNIRIEFTMPEALTEWKLMAFAHTKDMSTGVLRGSVKTQKDLMVMPNLPRFLRQGDEIVISTKISNLSDKELSGVAKLELRDAQTLKAVNLPFRLTKTDNSFTVAAGQSTTASWTFHVPESMYQPVLISIVAQSGTFADGEENVLPVVTNRMLVTETLPLWINGNGTKNFTFEKLKHSDSSKTLANHALTLEYTGNPAWYAVQALPYLMEYPYECAEQTFNRYYATSLAAYIVNKSPKIKAVFDSWNTPDFSSLKSPLENNAELKTALLEETPWVMDAKNETEQKKRIALLFEANKLSRSLDANMKKLKDMQLGDGSFPWFKGMYADRYITQYIVTGLGRLDKLGVKDGKGTMQEIISRAVPYLDRQIKVGYDGLIRNKANMDEQQIGYMEVQWLYVHSFGETKPAAGSAVAYDYYKGQAAKYWPRFNAYMKGMIAIALHRSGDIKTPKVIIQSLKETAIKKEEMGMYWVDRGYSYWWYDAPIETQSLLIECFKEVANDNESVDAMKVWLLKQKQTQNWHTTKATADACYALLLSGTDWLSKVPTVVVGMGQEVVNSSDQNKEAGSGYFKVRYEGKDISPAMGDVKLTVTDNASSTSWGAIYWQYFEDMDKISSAKTPLELRKQLFIERNTDHGPELQAITDGNSLKVGDKVKIRIELSVDRDMDYVQLKDMRASCFEPVNVISGYSWQGGLGYYQSTKDISTNFFFDHLRRGKYVFEYPVFVNSKGDFSNGIATIQCMYAPEFSSHSEGIRVRVR